MKTRTAVALLAAAALLTSACAGNDPAAGQPADVLSATQLATPEPSPTATSTDAPTDEPSEPEGEPRDPAALFGEDACDAILAGLRGERDDLDRYTTAEVRAELDSDGAVWAEAVIDLNEFGDCELSVGDVTYTLTLMGDGHVGHSAVAVTAEAGPDAGGELQTAIRAAVAERRGVVCVDPDEPNGADHETYVVDGLVVVAVRCYTGAYQSDYVLQGYDEAAGELFDLDVVEQYDHEGGGLFEDPEIIGFLDLDGDGLLSAVSLDRGIGDCGRVQTWYAMGRSLLLSSVEAMTCDAADGTSYEDGWPTVYPSGD